MAEQSGTERSRAGRTRAHWSLRRSLAVLAAVAGVLTALMITSGTYRLVQLSNARAQVVDRIDPAYRQVERLTLALVDQETGVRGFALGRSPVFLAPYRAGRAEQDAAVAELRRMAGEHGDLGLADDLDETVARAQVWRTRYAADGTPAAGDGPGRTPE